MIVAFKGFKNIKIVIRINQYNHRSVYPLYVGGHPWRERMVVRFIKAFQFYGYSVIQILIEPKQFFTELSNNTTVAKSLGFCVFCTIFYVIARLLTGSYQHPVQMGLIFFFNSVGMVFISAFLGYMIMVMTQGKKSSFKMFFGIQAFSSGVVMMVSWVS